MFGAFKGMGDIAGLMAKAQEMKAQAEEMQRQLDLMEVEGTAEGGAVRAIVTGKGKLKGLTIAPALVASADPSQLESLIVLAVAQAQDRASESAKEQMAQLTEGMPIPPGLLG